MLRLHTFPSYIRPGVLRIFLTAPLSYAAVDFPHDHGEKLLGYGKLATSSMSAHALNPATLPFLTDPFGVVAEAGGATALVTTTSGELSRVNLATGAVTTLVEGLTGPRRFVLEAGGAAALVLNKMLTGLSGKSGKTLLFHLSKSRQARKHYVKLGISSVTNSRSYGGPNILTASLKNGGI